MKFIKYLQEEYVLTMPPLRHSDYGFNYKYSPEIFHNPSLKELRELEQNNRDYGVRFIVDTKKKDIYVWSSLYLHWRAVEALGMHGVGNVGDGIRGAGDIRNGKIKVSDSDAYFDKEDADWQKRYFIINDKDWQ